VDVDRETLLLVLAVAAVAPLAADLPARVRVPTVVAEILLGIVVGPDVLGLAETDDLINVLSQFGLAFLFFLAGMEIDFDRIRGAPATLAARGWGLSLAIGLAAGGALYAADLAGAPVLVGLALTTTALGALVPIMKDAGLSDAPVGRFALAAGAAGELAPIVMLSLVLAVISGDPWRSLLLVVFALVAVAVAAVALRARPPRVTRLIQATMHSSGQLAVRLSMLLLAVFFVLAGELKLDVVLGAFTAGLIVGLVTHDESAHDFRAKLEAIGYGFLIPIFFVETGLTFDLDALFGSVGTVALVPLFMVLFLVARGTPAWLLYRGQLDSSQRTALALLSASALPLVVAITEVAHDLGRLGTKEETAMVGAAMLTLLFLPAVAIGLTRRP